MAALGGLLFGFDTAVINGAIPFFSDYFQLSDTLKGWAVSAALIGCVLGALFIGRPGDYFGRRNVLKFLGLLFLISAVGTGVATELWIFIFFRFVGGLAVGGASVLSPMYISEISPPAYRGRLTVTFQLAIVTGILVAFFADFLLIDTGENNWRWMFLSEGIPAMAFFVLLFYVEKSPRWLVKAGDIDRAREVIMKVDPVSPVDKTLKDIQEFHQSGGLVQEHLSFQETLSSFDPDRHRHWHVQPVYRDQCDHVLCHGYFQDCRIQYEFRPRTNGNHWIDQSGLYLDRHAGDRPVWSEKSVIDRFFRNDHFPGIVFLGLFERKLPGFLPAGLPDRFYRIFRLFTGGGNLGIAGRDVPE